MKVSLYSKKDDERWMSFLGSAKSSSIYHHPAWKTLWEEVFPHKPYYLMASENGEDLLGILPMFYIKSVFGKRLVSVPLRDRGGPLVNEDSARVALISAALDLGKKLSVDYVEFKDFDASDVHVRSLCKQTLKDCWVSSVIDLERDPSVLWSRLDNNATGPVKQAMKSGVVIEERNDIEGAEAFSRIFSLHRKHLGVPTYPVSFFRSLQKHLVSQGKAKYFIALHRGKPIAGMVVLINNDVVVDGYAASLPGTRSLRPNDLLVWHAIEWAAGNGYRQFDFGSDSPLQAGLLSFKKKWCARQERISNTRYQLSDKEGMMWDSSHDKYTWHRKAFSILPQSLYNTLSGYVMNRIG